jgi:hypothetical protein
MMVRRMMAALWALFILCPQLALAETVTVTTPADFGLAAAACIDAVSPDKLDADKLSRRGWKKQGNDKAPFGEVSVFQHASNSARILAGLRPSGYCIVDAYSQNANLFEAVQTAIEERLKTEFGMSGLTDVKSGEANSSIRRQGFVIGNAVGGFSTKTRQAGLNLRFTTVNAQFAGSPKAFQTSRPPLSEAEIAENSAEERQHETYAGGLGSPADIVPLVNACATALRTNSGLAGSGWNKSIHASGTPRSVQAIENRDSKAMMAGMAHTRQVLYWEGHRGLVTKYFYRGAHVVCEALIKIDPAQRNLVSGQVVSALGLSKPQKASSQITEFAAEYNLDNMIDAYAMNGSTVVLHAGAGTSLETPDPEKPTFSVFVF